MDITDFYKGERYGSGDDVFGQELAPRLRIVAEVMKRDLDMEVKVLDVGAGEGLLLQELVRSREVDPYAVDLSRLRLQQLGQQGVTAFEADISQDVVPIEDNFFDAVVMAEIIEHVFDGQQAINEAFRVLKPGGRLYITTHNSFNVWMRLKYLSGRVPAPSLDVTGPTMGEHIRLFNELVLRRLLNRAGFKDVKSRHFFKYKQQCVPVSVGARLLATHLFFVVEK